MTRVLNCAAEPVSSTQRQRFEESALPHLEALWKTARWLTLPGGSAEDLVSDTMAEAYRTWEDSDDPVGSKARLFKILTREFLDADKRMRQGGRPHPKVRTIPSAAGIGDGQRSLPSLDRREQLLLTTIPAASVKNLIARLGPRSRLLLLLLLREGFSYGEISYITGLRKDSVRRVAGKLHRLIPMYLLRHADGLTATADAPTPLKAQGRLFDVSKLVRDPKSPDPQEPPGRTA